jgi:hypothetical protein
LYITINGDRRCLVWDEESRREMCVEKHGVVSRAVMALTLPIEKAVFSNPIPGSKLWVISDDYLRGR